MHMFICSLNNLLFFFWILKTDPRRAENFDKIFTRVPIRLTPVDTAVLEANMRGDEFSNFTYYNPYFSTITIG